MRHAVASGGIGHVSRVVEDRNRRMLRLRDPFGNAVRIARLTDR